MSSFDLSIVVVNWNSKDYLRDCLESIQKFTSHISYEAIIVDNASFDGSGELVESLGNPTIRFKQLSKNIGFSGANNEGVKLAKGNYILFLNPDTVLINNAIEIMLESLKHGNAGAVGCLLLNGDDSIQTSCVLPFPTILNQALDFDWLKNRTRRCSLWGYSAIFENRVSSVQALSGACILTRRDILQRVGGFSSDYFMYSEDIDLCKKIAKVGHPILFVPQARIRHFGGGSTLGKTASEFSVVLMRESIFLYLKKFRSLPYAICYRVVMGFMALIRTSLLLLLTPLVAVRVIRMSRISFALSKSLHNARWALGIAKPSQTVGRSPA